jgi:hypothetical protein
MGAATLGSGPVERSNPAKAMPGEEAMATRARLRSKLMRPERSWKPGAKRGALPLSTPFAIPGFQNKEGGDVLRKPPRAICPDPDQGKWGRTGGESARVARKRSRGRAALRLVPDLALSGAKGREKAHRDSTGVRSPSQAISLQSETVRGERSRVVVLRRPRSPYTRTTRRKSGKDGRNLPASPRLVARTRRGNPVVLRRSGGSGGAREGGIGDPGADPNGRG